MKRFLLLSALAATMLTVTAENLPVVTNLTVDAPIISKNFVINYPVKLSFDVTNTDTEPRAIEVYPAYTKTDSTAMAFGYNMITDTIPAGETRHITYNEAGMLSGALVAGEAKMAICTMDENFNDRNISDVIPINIINGKPSFNFKPTVTGGSEDVDPTNIEIVVDVNCIRGDGGTQYYGDPNATEIGDATSAYKGKWYLYFYDNAECKSGTSILSLSIAGKMKEGHNTLAFHPSAKHSFDYGTTYYYKCGYLASNGKVQMFSTKYSFTTAQPAAVSAVEADNAEATAEYYNALGTRVNKSDLEAGQVYIRRCAGKAMKMIAK